MTATLPVHCTAGTAGAPERTCRLIATLTVNETVKRGQVIAVASRNISAMKSVVLGSLTRTLSPRQTTTLRVKLTNRGARLLAMFHSLKANLTIAQAVDGTETVISRTPVTFKARPRH